MTAAHTTPANRTWQMRRYEEVVLQVWRAIANSGPRGISFADIRTRLNNIDAEALKAHLAELRRKGHTHFNSVSGSTRYGCWIATATPPPTEDVPAWMQSLVESEASTATAASAGAPSEADETVAAARAQPNSVFAIAGDRAAFGVDIDAVHMPAQHLQALADAAPPAPPSGPAEPVPEHQPTAAAPPPPMPEQTVFAYSSDHRFLMRRPDGQTFVLDAAETAALMRYLSVLLHFDPADLAEAQQ